MIKDEALKLAMEALEEAHYKIEHKQDVVKREQAITAIKETLAEPKQEPVAFINVEQRKLEWAKYMSWDTPTVVNLPKIPLYTTPPQRKPLTDEEIETYRYMIDWTAHWSYINFARAIEAAHGIKENT